MIHERIGSALRQPFVGVTTDGTPVGGLYRLERTGHSLRRLTDAARSFLARFEPEQRQRVSFEVRSQMWRAWSNISPFLFRHGLLLESLSREQRELALELVRQTFSASGFETARNVMRLNETIAELTGRPHEYGEWVYFVSLFGTPSEDEPWGWQLDGHHLNLNCLVLGDQLVVTPQFMGSEPVLAESGRYAGTRVFEEEEARGFVLMSSLSTEQQDVARVGMQLPFDALATSPNDNLVLPYAGIGYGDLTPAQRQRLVELIGVYAQRLRPGHADLKMNEAMRHIDDTHFAWIGACEDESPFYYRVQSPVVLIEFDHQPGVALDNDYPSRNHVHTLVRTPNGNDYGFDLLRQHYERHHTAQTVSA